MNSMVTRIGTMSVFLAALLAPAAVAEQGILAFVFGPSAQEAAKQSARAAASEARHWMQTGGGKVEVRRAGSPDAQEVKAGNVEQRHGAVIPRHRYGRARG